MSEPINKIVFQDKDTSNTGNQEFYLPTGFRDKVKKDGATFQSYYTNENGVRKAVINGDWLVENSACDVNKGYIKYQGTDNYFRVIACYADPSLIKGQFTTNKNDSTVYYPFFKKGYEGSSRPIESSELHSFPGFKTATRGYEIINNKLYIKTNFVWPSSCLSGLIGEGSDNGAYFFQYAGDNSNNHTKTYILLNKTNYNIQTIDEVSVINDSSNGRITLSYKPTIKYSAIDSQINDLTISTASFTLEVVPQYKYNNILFTADSSKLYVSFQPTTTGSDYSGSYHSSNKLSIGNSTYNGRTGDDDDLFGIRGMVSLNGTPGSGNFNYKKSINNKEMTYLQKSFNFPSSANMEITMQCMSNNKDIYFYGKVNNNYVNTQIFGSSGNYSSTSYTSLVVARNINGKLVGYLEVPGDLVCLKDWKVKSPSNCRLQNIRYAADVKKVFFRNSQIPEWATMMSCEVTGYDSDNSLTIYYELIFNDGVEEDFYVLWPGPTEYITAKVVFEGTDPGGNPMYLEEPADYDRILESDSYILEFEVSGISNKTKFQVEGLYYNFNNSTTYLKYGMSSSWYNDMSTYGSSYLNKFNNATYSFGNSNSINVKTQFFPCKYITVCLSNKTYFIVEINYKKILMWGNNVIETISSSGDFVRLITPNL